MKRFHRTGCFYPLIALGSLFLGISPAYAQVCREAAGSDVANVPAANITCDMSYRDTVVTCDKVGTATTVGTRASCPAKPMPMITTPRKSYIGQFGVNGYSPYLFAYPRDPSDKTKPYAGAFYRGTPGDTSQTFQMIGNTAGSGELGGSTPVSRLAACVNQVKPTTVPTSAEEEAKLVRLQLDNCTNQYIMNASLYPFQKENSKLLSMEDPAHPSKRTELSSECQPLRTFSDTQNEYSASSYLKGAWVKLLQNPGYRMNPASISLPPMISQYVGGALGVAPGFEPQLPIGLNSLNSPIAPPDPFPEITLAQIGSVPYEEIFDPSHPFSPRWNFIAQDRTYSPLTAGYMSPSENAVFCAGVREDRNETDARKKEEKEIKVDVLEFRRGKFEEGLFNRISFNYLCQTNGGAYPEGTTGEFFSIISNAWCVTPYFTGYPPVLMAIAHDCQKCFGTQFPTDDESSHPPCTTNYLGKDLKINGFVPGLRNGFNRTASCTATGLYRDKKYNMDKLCRDIRKPYTQLNKLKMRYHNPDDENDPDKKNVVLRKGVMEGLSFKEYFGNHMPYPRLWDTGLSLHKQGAKDGNYQDPMDTTGQWTAIVGVGREGAAGDPNNAAVKKHADERCMLGGWGGVLPVVTIPGGMSVTLPDPVTSWTELKLYQSRTLRQTGMSCLARYEKTFKAGSSENMALAKAGGEWSKAIIAICPVDQICTAANSEYKTAKEFKDMGGNAGVPQGKRALTQVMNDSWPLAWRGYMQDPNTDNAFPKFGGDSGTMLVGMDYAKKGDLVLMPYGGTNNILAPGLPKVGFVLETNLPNESNCASRKNCYVKIAEFDNGKWPDVCGTTDNWGEMKTRYLYKPGMLPAAAAQEYSRIGYTKSCEDTKISQCELENWSLLQIYRATDTQRDGCDQATSAQCNN